MSKLKACTLVVLLSTLAFAQESRADTNAPPLEEQVKQAAQWFTGSFNNGSQVANNPSVPFISMSNCAVQLVGANSGEETQNVYVEQRSTAFNRLRFYSFSPENSTVTLSISSFVNQDLLSGTCNKAEPERIVSNSNIVATSCDLELVWQDRRYVGTNAPNGCPTSSGGRVVSDVAILDNGVSSLDQIFDASGNLLIGTPIEFQRVESVPEPSLTLGLLAFGVWSAGEVLMCILPHYSSITANFTGRN